MKCMLYIHGGRNGGGWGNCPPTFLGKRYISNTLPPLPHSGCGYECGWKWSLHLEIASSPHAYWRDFIECCHLVGVGSPHYLLRLCRVQVRQMLGPATFTHMLPSLRLPPSLGGFMQEMAGEGVWEREGSLVKEAALQGGSEEYWQLHQANP